MNEMNNFYTAVIRPVLCIKNSPESLTNNRKTNKKFFHRDSSCLASGYFLTIVDTTHVHTCMYDKMCQDQTEQSTVKISFQAEETLSKPLIFARRHNLFII